MTLKRTLLALLIAAVLGACASAARTDQLEATLRLYERALRWSEFKNAFAIAGHAGPAPDLQHLREIKVVSYDNIGPPRTEADGKKHSQTVEIRYVNILNMSERTLTDQQVWVYLEPGQRWQLTSPFPSFPGKQSP